MTAFDRSTLPPEIDTFEKLISYCCDVMQDLNPTTLSVADTNEAHPFITSTVLQNTFTNKSTTQFHYYQAVQLLIPLNVNWKRKGLPFYSAEEVNPAPLPVEFQG